MRQISLHPHFQNYNVLDNIINDSKLFKKISMTKDKNNYEIFDEYLLKHNISRTMDETTFKSNFSKIISLYHLFDDLLLEVVIYDETIKKISEVNLLELYKPTKKFDDRLQCLKYCKNNCEKYLNVMKEKEKERKAKYLTYLKYVKKDFI